MLSSVQLQWQVDEETSTHSTQLRAQAQATDPVSFEEVIQENTTARRSPQAIIIHGLILLIVLGGTGYQRWNIQEANKLTLSQEQQLSSTTITPGHHAQMSSISTEYASSTTTQFFQLRYQAQDAAMVQTIVPRLDKLYATMWQALNRSVSARDEKLKLEITPTKLPVGWQVQKDRILISSALASDAPDATAATSFLLTTLRDALAYYILAQNVDTTTLHPQWQLALVGFRQWLRTVSSLEQTGAALWSPPCLTLKRSPFSFTDSDWAYLYHQKEEIELAQTLVAYVARAYGPVYINAMLQAFADEYGWQTLLPVVFGQSAAEFATDWQRAQNMNYLNCSQVIPQSEPKISSGAGK